MTQPTRNMTASETVARLWVNHIAPRAMSCADGLDAIEYCPWETWQEGFWQLVEDGVLKLTIGRPIGACYVMADEVVRKYAVKDGKEI